MCFVNNAKLPQIPPRTGYSATHRAHLLILPLLVIGLGRCANFDADWRQAEVPALVPFADLFARPDTIRLDPDILVGELTALDVDHEGRLLVADRVSRATYHFSAAGHHIRTYEVPTCKPDNPDSSPLFSRHLGGGRIMVAGWGGAITVFDETGLCVATEMHPMPVAGVCTGGDKFFVFPWYRPFSGYRVIAVSHELEELKTWEVAPPKFRLLNTLSGGMAGSALGCFDDGPYYTVLEWPDAMPVRQQANWSRIRPTFFSIRTEDLRRRATPQEMVVEKDVHPSNIGVWAIDGGTRMLAYGDMPPEWATEDIPYPLGLAVVSNAGLFRPRSTLAPIWPQAAGKGYVYSVGDHESMSDGDIGNPVILRFRFIPPSDVLP